MSYENDIVAAVDFSPETSLVGCKDLVNIKAVEVNHNFAAFFDIHQGNGRGKSRVIGRRPA